MGVAQIPGRHLFRASGRRWGSLELFIERDNAQHPQEAAAAAFFAINVHCSQADARSFDGVWQFCEVSLVHCVCVDFSFLRISTFGHLGRQTEQRRQASGGQNANILNEFIEALFLNISSHL